MFLNHYKHNERSYAKSLLIILLELKLITNFFPNTLANCEDYDGVANPKNPQICCTAECKEFCGASNCSQALNVSVACCKDGIEQGKICGLLGRKAPCSLSKIPSKPII